MTMASLAIMIVEDDLIIGEHLKEMLEKGGHRVGVICASGEEALTQAEKMPFDLVLMDIALAGELDGIQTAEQLWEKYRFPFMFISAYSDNTLLAKAKNVKPFGYLIKPVNERQLQVTIEMAFYRFEAERALQEAQQQLESRIEQRTRELTATNERLSREIEERRRLEKLVNRVVESERKQLGQDLHDGLGQILTGISLRGLALQQDLERTSPVLAEHAKQIVTLANDASQRARQVSRLLFPVGILSRGLKMAFEELVAHVSSLPSVRCSLEFDADLDRLFCETSSCFGEGVALALYRIAQEALTNAVKHGKPHQVKLSFQKKNHGACLTIWNDGESLAPNLESKKGLGMEIMAYRAQMIGASCLVENASGGGVSVVCHLPLNHSQGTCMKMRGYL